MGIEQIRATVLANPAAAAEIYSKADLYGVIEDLAQKSKGSFESIYQARSRVSKSAEGILIMKAYSMAKAGAMTAPVAEKRVSESEFRKAHDNALARIDEIARKIAANEKMSLTQARADAWIRNPAIKAEYDSRRQLRLMSGHRA